MIAFPGATVQEYADRLNVSRRTVERWRRYPAFEDELHEQSRRHYQSTLVPLALDAAKRILQNPGGRADQLVIEILRGQGLLGINRVDVHHSGMVVTDNADALREQILMRVQEVREGREQQAMRALPEIVAGDVVEAVPADDADHADGDRGREPT
jgi:hypothetical protein